MWEVTGNLCNLHSILFLYLGLLAYQDLEVAQPRNWAYVRSILVEWRGILVSRLAAQPVLGDRAAAWMYRAAWRPIVVGLPVAALLLFRLARRATANRILLLLVPLSASAMCALTCFVRDGAIPYFHGYRMGLEDIRYTFVLAPFGLISWFAALRDARHRSLQPAYLAVFAGLSAYRFFLAPMGPERDWPPKGALLEASRRTGTPAVVTIPLNPKGWQFTYRAPAR